MKKQIKLSQGGKLFVVAIQVNDESGQIESCTTKQVTFTDKDSVTFSALLSDESKARYQVNLIDGVADCYKIEKAVKSDTVPLYYQIAGKSKQTDQVIESIKAIAFEYDSIILASPEEAVQKILEIRHKALTREAVKLFDRITSRNAKKGNAYSVQDFLDACFSELSLDID